MKPPAPTYKELVDEIAELRARSIESDDILRAIRHGEVDAVLAQGPNGDQLFTLKGADEPYRVLIEAMNQGAVTLSEDGSILYCNRRFGQLLKTPLEKVVGSAFEGFVAPSERAAFALLLETSRTAPSWGEITLQASDKTPVPLQLALGPLPTGSAAAICLVATDISESRERGERLHETMDALVQAEHGAEAARLEAVRANAAKSEFLANMSHEIRTPMNGIIGMTDLVLETGLHGDQREYLGMVKTSANALLCLINDILDFSKIEAGKLELESIDFLLRDCVEGLLKPLDLRAKQKGLELAAHFAPDIPNCFLGDPMRLRQILIILTDNAIKFTEHGKIVLGVANEAEGNGGTTLHFSVADTGIGIPVEKQHAIFGAFAQADGSTTRNYGGTGLGLAIASQMIGLMGGKIWLESAPGKGTTFHFTARFAAGDPGRVPAPPAPASIPSPAGKAAGAPSRGLRILVAEDNMINRALASGMLEKRGHSLVHAANGREAVEAAAREAFDLVFMDVQMPEMDGFEATRRIRETDEAAGRHTPIMAMTAHAMTGDRERCLAAGMDYYVSKPLQKEELVALVERIRDAGSVVAGAAATDAGGMVRSLDLRAGTDRSRPENSRPEASPPTPLASTPPPNEAERLEALHRYQILDSLPEQGFDDITLLASHICGTPIAMISLIDENRQWMKSKVGVTTVETPRDYAFCAFGISQPGVFAVEDALKDERFVNNPYVAGDPHIRFYAGAPLLTPDGHALGMLCVIDQVPRELSESKRAALEALSRQVMARLELRKMASKAHAILQEEIRERARAEHAYSQIMNHSLDVICTFDAEGRFLRVSRACETVWGYRADELIGRPFIDFVHPEDRVKTRAADEAILSGVPERDFENRYVRPDGSVVKMLWSSNWSEAYQTSFCVARDITTRKQLETGLLEAKEAAEASNRSKSEFLANMSHEIRTPMNGIMGMTELVLESQLDSEQSEYLGMVKSSADSLLGLINDILDFSKIEAGKLELEAIGFSLRDCIATLIKPLGMRADAKGLELTADIRPDVPDHLVGDPMRLRQILLNLTDNAIKFTACGDVMLRVAVDPAAETEHCLHFSVTDTGIGVPAEKHAMIFDAFSQADGTTSRTHGGTGLGLAIASQLVRKMGGRIWVESTPGKGTTFHFTACLPVRDTPSPSVRQPDPRRLQGLRVLVVDDNAINRRILCDMLANWQMEARAIDSGAAAIEEMLRAARAGMPFPLVILDGTMPGMDGFTVAGKIREHPELCGATVMMLSSAMPCGGAARCAAVGVSSYLTKPVAQAELLDAILVAIGDPTAREPAEQEAPAAERAVGMRILLAEDNAINRALAAGILEKRGHSVRHAANGHEAVEAAGREAFDLIFMDVQMPEMDGFEATRRIREMDATTGRHTRVVAMTAHAMTGDRERCVAAGMDDYLSKPLQKAALLAVLERVSAARKPAPPADPPAPLAKRPLPDPRPRPADRPHPGKCHWIARICGLFSLIIGLCVLTGWLFNIRPLLTLLPGLVSMKPMTALGLFLAGLSLLLLLPSRAAAGRHRLNLSAACAGAVALIGTFVLIEFACGLNFGIDGLAFYDYAHSRSAGRMAPITALNFVGVGIALLTLRFPKRAAWTHALAFGVAFTSLLAIVGYFYGVPSLYQAGHFTAVALHTAIGFLLLCIGLWCASSQYGFMPVVTGEGTSGTLVRRYGLIVLILPFLLNAAEFTAERHGWINPTFGTALFALINAVSLSALVWYGAKSLRAAERKESVARVRLRQAHDELEQRVVARTSELAEVNTSLQEQMRERARAEHAIRQIMDHSLDVICTMDAEGRFVQVSRACETLWGYPPEELIGRRYLDLVHPDDWPVTIETATAITNGAPASDFENRYIRRDGSVVPIVWTAKWSPEHRIMFCVARDITARKHLESEMLLAKEAAEASNRSKSEFLANMSHEIRTPMNGIMGMTELVLDTPLDPEQREYLGMVKSSADSLLGLINDILDFSKIEAGKLELEAISFSLRDCIGTMLKPLGVRADAKGLELTADIRPDVPDHLVGDPMRLRQILLNLTDNAIKFTKHGDVMLRVAVESRTEAEGCIHFSITDTGIGIPAAKQALIFEAFSQADGTTTRTHGGTGLGLTIATQLVRQMGGRIWVESAPGQGTTFHFTACLPVRDTPAPSVRYADPRRLKGLRVLVVDDNAINRRILCDMLTDWQTQPRSVDSGAAAIEEMLRAARAGTPFPLVILDGMMPEMDGFTVAEKIRDHVELSGATVMMLSSAMPAGAAARCAAVGVASYLTKPVAQAELLDAILVAVGGASAPEAAENPTPVVQGAGGLRILLAEDNVINRALAVGILEKRGHSLFHAANGREAVEAVTREAFDLVLMDVQMPEMNGIHATRNIRQMEEASHGSHVPIVAMTAHAMTGDRERCLDAGMDDYLSKPLKKAELLEVLERVANGRITSRDTARPTTLQNDPRPNSGAVPMNETSASAPPIFSRKQLLDQVDDDESLLEQMIALYFKNTPGMLAGVRDSIAQGNSGELTRSAHALLSSFGAFGAAGAHRLARQLEELGRQGSWTGASSIFADLERESEQISAALEEMTRPSA